MRIDPLWLALGVHIVCVALCWKIWFVGSLVEVQKTIGNVEDPKFKWQLIGVVIISALVVVLLAPILLIRRLLSQKKV